MKRITKLLVAGVLLFSSTVYAAVPQLINFQGILRDGSGNPVANGSYSVTFTIYDSSTAPPPGAAAALISNALWTETQSVTTNSGLFNVLLGSATPIPDSAFNDSSRYLGIKVGADPEMTPWLRLSSVGYSYNSSEWTSGIGSPFLLKGNAAVSPYEILYRLNGNVGIGTSNPLAKLDVLNTGSDAFDIKGIQSQVENASSGNAYGGYFATSTAGTGPRYGLYAQGNGSSTSGTPYGLYGLASGSRLSYTATGCFGAANNSGDAYGGYFTGTSSGGFPYVGYGVYGNSPAGYGVYGNGTIGVSGYSTVSNGVGVRGQADNGAGASGVYGSSSSGNAGYFSGPVTVTGFLTKSGGGFKIDHPLDPANKYLYHSFVESPDMKNIYDGVVTTNAKGDATVTMPEWCGALNKDFRYQLTVIGEFAQAIISEEISGNQFSIKTNKPKVKVSWQVTGIRQDVWAKAHRLPVEEVKSEKEQGYYLHPDLFGQLEEKGTEWARHPEMMKEIKEQREKAKADK